MLDMPFKTVFNVFVVLVSFIDTLKMLRSVQCHSYGNTF